MSRADVPTVALRRRRALKHTHSIKILIDSIPITMKIYQEAEQFINEIYWKETHDNRSNLKISDLVNEKLAKDNQDKDPEYYNHRTGVIHTSSLYGCLRGVIHSALGTPPSKEPDTRKLGVFRAGNLFEDYIVQSLGNRVIEQQREYEYKYKNITLVGRSDYRIDDSGIIRIGENKSVHSDAFWYRQREGTLIQWHNQLQLQIYLWLERILEPYKCPKCGTIKMVNKGEKETAPVCLSCKLYLDKYPVQTIEPEGIFSYISKDDCIVESAPVKFNQRIIDEVVIPALEIVNEGFTKKDANVAPLPSYAIFNNQKQQWQTNWLVKYCDYHNHCAGAGWILEAQDEVYRKNKEYKATLPKGSNGKKKSVVKPIVNEPKEETSEDAPQSNEDAEKVE